MGSERNGHGRLWCERNGCNGYLKNGNAWGYGGLKMEQDGGGHVHGTRRTGLNG